MSRGDLGFVAGIIWGDGKDGWEVLSCSLLIYKATCQAEEFLISPKVPVPQAKQNGQRHET